MSGTWSIGEGPQPTIACITVPSTYGITMNKLSNFTHRTAGGRSDD
jgi:hypothetical protein